MSRKEVFRQANREALITVIAAFVVMGFWAVAGFGLAQVEFTWLSTPLWVWGGCVGTWVFSIAVVLVLNRFVYRDCELNQKSPVCPEEV